MATMRDAELAFIEAARPTFISPDIFQPATSAAHTFLRNFERCATANGWRAINKIYYFGTFLDGDANTWYSNYAKDPANRAKTWEDVKADFTKTYGGEYFKIELRRKLRSFKQGPHQSIKEFYYELLEIMHEIGGNFSDEEIQAHFEGGLSEKYWDVYYLFANGILSKEQLRNIVFRLARHVDVMGITKCVHYAGHGATDSTQNQRTQLYSPASHEHQVRKRQIRASNERPRCYVCGRVGHLSYTCRMRNNSSRPICYKCTKVGHVARDCYYKGKSYSKSSFRFGHQRSPGPRQHYYYEPPYRRRRGSLESEGSWRDGRSRSRSPIRKNFGRQETREQRQQENSGCVFCGSRP